MVQSPPKYLQENLLTLLIWYEDEGKLIRNALPDPYYFESVYHNIASAAYAYIDRFEQVPGDHIADLLDKDLQAEGIGKLLRETLVLLHNNKARVQPSFVLPDLEKFVRTQSIKESIMDAADLIQRGSDQDIQDAEEILSKAADRRLAVFEPGVFLNDLDRALAFLDKQDAAFPTGVKILDKLNLGPQRATLHVLIALPKMGKSWWMVQLGKQSWLHGYNVCHISLEMGEDQVAQRYIQSMFGVSKRNEQYTKMFFDVDEKGYFSDFLPDELIPKFNLQDPEIEHKLRTRMKELGPKLGRVVIKEFPTGSLTVPEIYAYLDNLQSSKSFIPDLLIIDYPDLMRIATENYRHDLGKVYKDLRGLAVKRNIGVAAVSQSNRFGADESVIKDIHIGEDFSKIATADVILSYNQTLDERKLGLARIFVADARSDEDKFIVLLSQAYHTGQFCLDSIRLFSDKKYVKALKAEDEDDDDHADQQVRGGKVRKA